MLRRKLQLEDFDETIRIIDYYDLIEFPSGRHIPVPLAIKWFGWGNVLKIPISEKKRNDWFYWCDECFEDAEERGEIYEGSFFKCMWHSSYGKDTYSKKVILEIFFKLGFHDLLKYVEVDENSVWARRNFAVIKNGRIECYGRFEHILNVVGKWEEVVDW